MIENLGGITSELTHVALDAAMLRQQVIANNIANVNTPGFIAKRVNFEAYLSSFINGSVDTYSSTELSNEIQQIKAMLADVGTTVSDTGEEVQLDSEMVKLTENVLRYRTLLEASSKRGELLKMAIREGR